MNARCCNQHGGGVFQLKYARATACDRNMMGIMKNALSIHCTPPCLLSRGDIVFKVIVITQKVFNVIALMNVTSLVGKLVTI